MKIRDEDALKYHSHPKPGKLEVLASKPCFTQRDLSMAYTPGVAVPCKEIERDEALGYTYTNKSNLVAVVSNGTAVLGLGDIGALAGKPVMEGKGVLFKRFANVDVFDIELNTHDSDEIIRACELMEPTFGGINLEDIKAPECFYIEEQLKEKLNIPVFHDDQHGTAIISGAGLINAAEILEKDISKARMVVVGAGAAGIACAKIFEQLGVTHENIIMCDSKGVIYKGRKEGMNPYKEDFAWDGPERTLEDALNGAEIFIGLAKKDLLTEAMLKSMGNKPIIFAMANPDPEVLPEVARKIRPDAIVATGRSDYPNQVNNVLGFPFIFRGALDVRATAISEEMKIAACYALANLAKEDVPDEVRAAYPDEDIMYGPDYIIPKPFDPRVLLWVAPAVAQAAIDGGLALKPFESKEKYIEKLENMLGKDREVMRIAFQKAQKKKARIVYPEGSEEKVLRAAQIVADQGIAEPILLGNEDNIRRKIKDLNLHLDDVKIIDPLRSDMSEGFAEMLFLLRKRKGMTPPKARRLIRQNKYFGMMMVHHKDYADGLVGGLNMSYQDLLRPALEIVGIHEGVHRVIGVYMMVFRDKLCFFADTTVNQSVDANTLAEAAMMTAELAEQFNVKPKVAMLSYANFGEQRDDPEVRKVGEAVDIVKERMPELIIDGEMMADAALDPETCGTMFPHSVIKGDANVFIFPNLSSGNIAYKLLQKLGGAEAIGPMLLGLAKPVNILNYASKVSDIVNLSAITALRVEGR